jgi:hemerythrin
VNRLVQPLPCLPRLKFAACPADEFSMFEWNDDYSVGVGSVDAQHRSLFAISRELHAAMTAGQAKSALAKVLDRLVQYTVMHFAHEERLMRQYEYPGYEAHHAEHEALTKQVVKFQEEFASGKALITIQLLTFLKDWLQKHIKGSDMKAAAYFKMKKVA